MFNGENASKTCTLPLLKNEYAADDDGFDADITVGGCHLLVGDDDDDDDDGD